MSNTTPWSQTNLSSSHISSLQAKLSLSSAKQTSDEKCRTVLFCNKKFLWGDKCIALPPMSVALLTAWFLGAFCIQTNINWVSKLKYQGADSEGEIRLEFLIEHAVTTTNWVWKKMIQVHTKSARCNTVFFALVSLSSTYLQFALFVKEVQRTCVSNTGL